MASLSLLTRDEGEKTKDETGSPPPSFSLHPFKDVLFLNPVSPEKDANALERLVADPGPTRFIAIISTFGVHFGDEAGAAVEARLLDQMQGWQGRFVVIRVGNLLGEHSRTSVWLRRLGFAFPLVPGRLRSCFVTETELSGAIDAARSAPTSRRVFTLLGPNRPWRDMLREHRAIDWCSGPDLKSGLRLRANGVASACLTAICYLLALLMVGEVAALVLDLLVRWRPALRRWNFDTLRPRSFDELLALYNPHNFQHLRVVGYNNGVVHFGHRYPGKTIVSTVLCNRIVRTQADVIKADCGATIRKATDFLAAADQELYVLPNYSYVCVGTAFFVPIHGSAADYATVAETFVKALLYDPVSDRTMLATSDQRAFQDHVYNQASTAIVLRLWIRVKAKSRYFVRSEDLVNPTSEELLKALRDEQATNVEIRKASAADAKVQLSKYYKALGAGAEPGLEFPRDSLGRLWDRLEENAVTSFLMHALTRWLAWHVELFFTADEFATFWKTHQTLPLRKIQLRYIRRDGLPHSPFREHDCVSVDMFMFRWNRRAFEAYLKQAFAVVRSNPGKHSA